MNKFKLKNRDEYISHCHIVKNEEFDMPVRLESAHILIRHLRDYVGHFLSMHQNGMRPYFERIFSTIPDTHENPVVLVNIISLQCVTLITSVINPDGDCSSFSPVIWSDFKIFTNKIREYKSLATNEGFWACSTCKYENISPYVCEMCQSEKPPDDPDGIKEILQLYSAILYPTGTPILLVIIKFLSIDEIISSYLKKLYMAGIPTEMSRPHGVWLTPLQFIEHDIGHAVAYKINILPLITVDNRISNVYNLMSFYEYTLRLTNEVDKEQIKFIIFLLVHESYNSEDTNFFFYRRPLEHEKPQDYYDYCYQLIRTGLSISGYLSRLLDEHDLALLIRKFMNKTGYQDTDAVETSLMQCVRTYVTHIYRFFGIDNGNGVRLPSTKHKKKTLLVRKKKSKANKARLNSKTRRKFKNRG